MRGSPSGWDSGFQPLSQLEQRVAELLRRVGGRRGPSWPRPVVRAAYRPRGPSCPRRIVRGPRSHVMSTTRPSVRLVAERRVIPKLSAGLGTDRQTGRERSVGTFEHPTLLGGRPTRHGSPGPGQRLFTSCAISAQAPRAPAQAPAISAHLGAGAPRFSSGASGPGAGASGPGAGASGPGAGASHLGPLPGTALVRIPAAATAGRLPAPWLLNSATSAMRPT